ncbi:hypothetical protein [Butyrivibrio sp. INlla16]|uniref:hypothetical protein n=1 Tax=Butyrivibrio sp. INlla16 TaxID=1520807 RepID=UPI0008907FA3|nr:hypothetical protein [Butyrivibrio sp. INlla16]SDB36435.1 hypothetical protein SAMN02910263_01762 [Butyrivibrio sp. INlla16]
MKTEDSKNYRYILEEFGSDVVEKRTNWLKELMDSYIDACHRENFCGQLFGKFSW